MQNELERNVARAKKAAGEWFAEEMELCPGCRDYFPFEELVALIGTPRLCSVCRIKEQTQRLDMFGTLAERETWPLGLS
jgi:hypothetical protein